ncbi:uncharacterized protein PITG_17647 [Phytophthora infestans T30-4]|uniref:Tc1-like transposase DDE domain-containing protein n=1 Tax=Phytophthora infestans (strain T30-4) TaxID=403677 RepID=D0NWJ4_PHYIT|nr:uncharacterized protein PITG_17647 [Phytophthora infestans T30-4]EEY67057.1 conserved hypothetical protein [Phytophthora infestans T30-4]|eukprot:XP_002896509.1 conserved hypothetical protein [Phytophthora infestans T30-4]
MPTEPKHGLAARTRVLDAHKAGQDWALVADCNGIPATTARTIVERGTPDIKKRGGARATCTKCTPEMEEALVEYLEDNCQYTLVQMQEMLHFDFGGRALIGQRAVVKLPPSKGANLQLQCAVSPEVGLVHYAKQRGSIKMEVNAAFVDAVYEAVKRHDVYRDHFAGKTVVIVLDNAPAHSQTEDLITEQEDLELLRLAPYSPMCNPIEVY